MAERLTAQLFKRHGSFTLDVELALEAGVTALVGPSGSGKTTLLRCLAGLERPERGRIAWGTEVWLDTEARRNAPPQARRVGMIFQSHALFPHLNVRDNVAFSGAPAARVDELLARFEVADLAARYPREISAGQAQRVAIARALAAEPHALLMDEPFANLDLALKSRLYDELAAILAALGLPVLVVTHDFSEAARLAERMLVLVEGRLAQDGRPEDVLYRPSTAEVAALAGVRNVFTGAATGPHTLALGPHALPVAAELEPGRRYRFCVRADAVAFAESGLGVVIEAMRLTAEGYRVLAAIDEAGAIEVLAPLATIRALSLTSGKQAHVFLPPDTIHVLGPC